MESHEILELFKEKSALLEGHFELASKKHSSNYLQCALILQHPDLTNRLCKVIAERFKNKVDLVAGPAIGGIIIAYEIARILGVRAIYAERKEEALELRRGFEIKNGDRILLVEDVITTGGSVLELASLCERMGGQVVGIATLIDRTGGKNKMPYHLEALVQIDLPTYERDQCPMCRKNLPLVKPGSQKLVHR
jgi:orotate phosphoribosyltransferase